MQIVLTCGKSKIVTCYKLHRCVDTQSDSSCYGTLLEEYHAEDVLSIFRSSEFEDLRLVFEISAGSRTCQSFFRVLLCFFEFPPCNISTSELFPICLDRCPEIQAAYQYCFRGFNFEAISPERYPDLRNIIENFNCSLPNTYYFSNDRILDISNTSCSKLLHSCLCMHCKL